jgi:hypothetical protein
MVTRDLHTFRIRTYLRTLSLLSNALFKFKLSIIFESTYFA